LELGDGFIFVDADPKGGMILIRNTGKGERQTLKPNVYVRDLFFSLWDSGSIWIPAQSGRTSFGSQAVLEGWPKSFPDWKHSPTSLGSLEGAFPCRSVHRPPKALGRLQTLRTGRFPPRPYYGRVSPAGDGVGMCADGPVRISIAWIKVCGRLR
jgi:hypothetical protein